MDTKNSNNSNDNVPPAPPIDTVTRSSSSNTSSTEEAPIFISPPAAFTQHNKFEETLERHNLPIPRPTAAGKARFHERQARPRRHESKRKQLLHPLDRSQIRLKKFSAKIHLVLSVCDPTSHKWRTAPVSFDQFKDNDQDVWWEIRRAYRDELQKEWRRWLFFRKLKYIVPIEYTHNGVPTRHKPADYLDARVLLHAYHHPGRIRPDRLWIDWLVHLKNSGDPGKSYGLEFVEGLWVEKLVWASTVGTAAITLASILWPLLGGEIGDVFTTLDFVESWFAIMIALIGIYYTAILSEI